MTIETVAILSPGDMGHAVGRALADGDFRLADVPMPVAGAGEMLLAVRWL